MRNLLRVGVTTIATAAIVLSGAQASLDWSNLTTSNQLAEQGQVYQYQKAIRDMRTLAEQARNGFDSGHHSGG